MTKASDENIWGKNHDIDTPADPSIKPFDAPMIKRDFSSIRA